VGSWWCRRLAALGGLAVAGKGREGRGGGGAAGGGLLVQCRRLPAWKRAKRLSVTCASFFFFFFIYVPLDLDPSHPPLALLTAHGFLFFRKKNLFGAKKKSNLQTSSLLARYLSWTLVPSTELLLLCFFFTIVTNFCFSFSETRGREMEFIYLFCFFIIIIEAGRAWMMPP
jgi:hypothetical protein